MLGIYIFEASNINMYLYICTLVHMQTLVHTVVQTHIHAHTRAHAHKHTHTHAHTHTHTHTYIYIYIYIYICVFNVIERLIKN